MVGGINKKAPPCPCAQLLLFGPVLPLLLLSVMVGTSRADMGCYRAYDHDDWYLGDPSKCWVTEINAAFNGKLDGCSSSFNNAVSRMRVRKCAVRSVLLLCATQVFLFASPLLLQFPE